MAEFSYNNKLITGISKDNNQTLLFNYLVKKYGETSKTLSTKELIDAISKTNVLSSLDLFLLNISEYDIDLSDAKNFEIIKPEIIKCATKKIKMFNEEIKEELVNKSDIIVNENKETTNEEIDYNTLRKFAPYLHLKRTFTFLRDTISNSKETGLIILEAENNADIPNLEVATVKLISHFVNRDLKLEQIIKAQNISEAQNALINYSLKNK